MAWLEGDKSRYPHRMLGLPFSLQQSAIWRTKLSGGCRDFYLHLLLHSSIIVFKPMWISRKRLIHDLDIHKRTIIRYETQLQKYGLLNVLMPGQRNIRGDSVKSKQYEFPIAKYINLDYIAFNKKHKTEVWPAVTDYHKLQKRLSRLVTSEQIERYMINDRTELLDRLQDEMSQRIKITGIDNAFIIHIDIHAKKFTTSWVADCFRPYNLQVKARQTRNLDFVIDKDMTFKKLLKKLAYEMQHIQRRTNLDELIGRLEF